MQLPRRNRWCKNITYNQMKVITWNVRGIYKVYKQKKVKKFIQKNDVGLVAY